MRCVFLSGAGSQERGSDFGEPCLTETHCCVLQTEGEEKEGGGGRTRRRGTGM